MKEIKLILAVVFVIIAYSVCLSYLAYKIGYATAIDEQQTKINLDTETLENHAKTLETIHSEPDTNAIIRLRKNLGTN